MLMVMGAFNRLLMASSKRGLSTTTTTICRNSSSPWLMLPPRAVADNYTYESEVRSMNYSFYRLSDKKIISLKKKDNNKFGIPRHNFCIGSSNGWLLYCDQRDFELYLTNPLSRTIPTIPLPLVYKFCCNHPLNVLPHQVIEKFSMSGPPESKDWVMLIVFKESRKLGIYNPKSKWGWITLDNPKQVPYIEAIYSSKEQLFYTLNLNGEIETWDLRDYENHKRVNSYQPSFNIRHDLVFEDECFCTKYLVESKGDILLVHRYSCSKNNIIENGEQDPCSKTRRFDVYRLNKADETWERMESLGDRVLFLGMNEPFSLSASDCPELKPNSIYFTGPVGNEGKYSATDWGIYNLDDHTVTCHFPCDYWLKIRPPPIWIDIRNTNDGKFN